MKVTRRHVLALLACASGAAATSGAGLYLRWWDRAPGDGLAVLSPDEYDTVQAVGEAWMPPGGTPAISGAEADMGGYFDQMIAHAPAKERKLLKALVQILDDAPLVTHASSFRALPLADRTALLKQWLASDQAMVRSGVQTLLLLLSEAYATHPAVVPHLGPFGCGYGR